MKQVSLDKRPLVFEIQDFIALGDGHKPVNCMVIPSSKRVMDLWLEAKEEILTLVIEAIFTNLKKST